MVPFNCLKFHRDGSSIVIDDKCWNYTSGICEIFGKNGGWNDLVDGEGKPTLPL